MIRTPPAMVDIYAFRLMYVNSARNGKSMIPFAASGSGRVIERIPASMAPSPLDTRPVDRLRSTRRRCRADHRKASTFTVTRCRWAESFPEEFNPERFLFAGRHRSRMAGRPVHRSNSRAQAGHGIRQCLNGKGRVVGRQLTLLFF